MNLHADIEAYNPASPRTTTLVLSTDSEFFNVLETAWIRRATIARHPGGPLCAADLRPRRQPPDQSDFRAAAPIVAGRGPGSARFARARLEPQRLREVDTLPCGVPAPDSPPKPSPGARRPAMWSGPGTGLAQKPWTPGTPRRPGAHRSDFQISKRGRSATRFVTASSRPQRR
jgi:hypothetical protein